MKRIALLLTIVLMICACLSLVACNEIDEDGRINMKYWAPKGKIVSVSLDYVVGPYSEDVCHSYSLPGDKIKEFKNKLNSSELYEGIGTRSVFGHIIYVEYDSGTYLKLGLHRAFHVTFDANGEEQIVKTVEFEPNESETNNNYSENSVYAMMQFIGEYGKDSEGHTAAENGHTNYVR